MATTDPCPTELPPRGRSSVRAPLHTRPRRSQSLQHITPDPAPTHWQGARPRATTPTPPVTRIPSRVRSPSPSPRKWNQAPPTLLRLPSSGELAAVGSTNTGKGPSALEVGPSTLRSFDTSECDLNRSREAVRTLLPQARGETYEVLCAFVGKRTPAPQDLASLQEIIVCCATVAMEREEACHFLAKKMKAMSDTFKAATCDAEQRERQLQKEVASLKQAQSSTGVDEEKAALQEQVGLLWRQLQESSRERRESSCGSDRRPMYPSALEATTQLRELRRELQEKDTEITRMREELDDLVDEHEATICERDTLAARVKHVEEELRDVRGKLGAQIDHKEREIFELREQMVSIRARDESQKEVERLLEALAQEEREKEEARHQWEEELAALRREVETVKFAAQAREKEHVEEVSKAVSRAQASKKQWDEERVLWREERTKMMASHESHPNTPMDAERRLPNERRQVFIVVRNARIERERVEAP